MTKWQSIETAPKDGTVILVWQRGKVWLSRWDSQRHNKHPRPFWAGGVSAVWGNAVSRSDPPTHWMPLPQPPEDDE